MENKLQNAGQNSIMDSFVKTDDILKDMCGIIESSQKAAHQAVNTLLVQRNWMIGYRIAEEEFGGQERSEYGLHVIKKLSKELTNRYGKGYDRGTLYRCLKFYKLFPEIVASLRQQSGAILSWTHYRILLQVEDKEARDWYEKEAAEQTWSVTISIDCRVSKGCRKMYSVDKRSADGVTEAMEDGGITFILQICGYSTGKVFFRRWK